MMKAAIHRQGGLCMMMLDELLSRFARGCEDILGDRLTGVYLHGSAVLGCFQPLASDVDLLVVTGGVPDDGRKRRLMDLTVALNADAPPKGIEMSVVERRVLKPFRYPTPFELHFSPMHLAWYQRDPEGYIAAMRGEDRDLAAHCMIVTRRGRALLGEAIGQVFGEVPQSDYLDSIRLDIMGAREDIAEQPVYCILTLCRVLATMREGLVLSKREGGQWGLERLPARYHALLRAALEAYATAGSMEADAQLCDEYAAYMLSQIFPEGMNEHGNC